jgi:PAS domain S-box-containing protein
MKPADNLDHRREFRVESLILPLLIGSLLLIGFVFSQDADGLQAEKNEVERIHRVIQLNQTLLSQVQDLELGLRGLLLTGDRSFLDPYLQVDSQVNVTMQRMESAIVREDQKARLQRLKALTYQFKSSIDRAVENYDRNPNDLVRQRKEMANQKQLMDKIRLTSSEIEIAAKSRAKNTSDEVDMMVRRSRQLVITVCVLLASALLWTLWMIQRATKRRKTLLDQIQEEGERFSTTLASIGDGVVTTDQMGLITFVNPVAESLAGWTKDQAVGRPINEVFHLFNERTGESVANPIYQALQQEKVVGLASETSLRRSDGTGLPIDDSAAPIFSKTGLAGSVMVFRDVSTRRKAEIQLRRWEQVFQGAGFGMMIISQGKVPKLDQTNLAFARMHGYELDELAGLDYRKLVDEKAWAAEEKLLTTYETGDHWTTESIHCRKDGTRFPVLTDYTLVRDLYGSTSYFIGYCSDISEQKAAEQELRDSEGRYRLTADSLPQLIWTSRADGTTEYLNQRWRDEAGLTQDDAPDLNWTRVIFDDDRTEFDRKWKESLGSGSTFQVDCRMRSQGGEPRWFTCRAVPVKDSQGQVIRWFGSCTDIHDSRMVADTLRRKQEELERSNAELQRSNADLEQFAYAASHDLQEPLRMVAIYSQLLRDEYTARLDDQARMYLQFAVEGALRMEALLKDLLTYARVARSQDPHESAVNVDDALQEALANLAVPIKSSGAVITVGRLCAVRMRKVHLVQVLQNLISNCIKYRRAEESPKIEINSQISDGWCTISVKDNGIGIDPIYQEQVFKLFGRLHTRDVPGTGIGLAICKKLVERNGGKIAIQSAVGRGSTFSFTVKG